MTQHTFEWTKDEDPCITVVEAVSGLSGRDIENLRPLQDIVDVDALSAFVENGRSSTDVRVSFRYEGFQIVVDGGGSVVVTPESDENGG